MKYRSGGFTIVELLIYTTVLLGLLYIFTGIFTTILDVQLESETQSVLVQDSGYIFSRFQYDVSRASAIVTPASLGGTSSTLVLTIDGNTYTYELLNGNLLLTEPRGSAALNSEGTIVSGVQFRRYGNTSGKHSVSIAFTLTTVTQRTGRGQESQTFQTTIGLR